MSLSSTEEALVRELLAQQAALLSLAGSESTILSKLGATKVTLSDLVAASTVNDADLLLTRQSTTDKSVTAQKIKEFAIAGAKVPAGTVIYYAGTTAPAGYTIADGTTLSRALYPELFAAIGTTYGAGDGSTTFNKPQLCGEFLRAADVGRGVDSGRVIGSWQKGSLVAIDTASSATETISVAAATTAAQAHVAAGYDAYNTSDYAGVSIAGSNSDGTATLPGTSEVYAGTARPRNVALLACIKL